MPLLLSFSPSLFNWCFCKHMHHINPTEAATLTISEHIGNEQTFSETKKDLSKEYFS